MTSTQHNLAAPSATSAATPLSNQESALHGAQSVLSTQQPKVIDFNSINTSAF